MKKSLKVLALAAGAALLTAAGALAEPVKVTAQVPFDFVVADQQLPSGEYRFVTSDEPGLVLIYSAKTGEHVATVLGRALPASADERGQLVFDRYGSDRFLNRIRSADGVGVFLPIGRVQSRAQAEAKAARRAEAQAAKASGETGTPAPGAPAAGTAMP